MSAIAPPPLPVATLADAEGVARREASAPAAHVERPDEVRRAEGVHQPTQKGRDSPIAVVEGEDWLNATLCGPCAAASRRIAAAVASSASSQEISVQPGSASPFGRVRRKGWVSRSLL